MDPCRRLRWPIGSLCLLLAGGCAFSPPPPPPGVLYEAAVEVIHNVLSQPVEPVADSTVPQSTRDTLIKARYQLQNQALEIAAGFPSIVQPQWLETGLSSPHDGVKLAGLLAVGRLADFEGGRLSRPHLARARELMNETVVVVRETGQSAPRNYLIHLAAAFAVYKITADPQVVASIPEEYLNRRTPPLGLGDKEFDKLRVQVVYVLSLMPAMSRAVLESALNDPDASVRLMAQNRLAILGHAKAMDLTINTIHTRTADDARDALEALEEAKMDDLMPLRKCLSNCWEPQKTPWGTVRYKARQQEIAMAAIRTLGVHKGTSDKELALALAWLNFKETEPPTPEQAQNDPWHEERVRFLAALALGGIGNFDRSAGPLLQIMKTSPSQRFRLAAAKASLEVLRRSDHWPIGVNFP